MHTMSAKDAKYGFGRRIDMARVAPITHNTRFTAVLKLVAGLPGDLVHINEVVPR